MSPSQSGGMNSLPMPEIGTAIETTRSTATARTPQRQRLAREEVDRDRVGAEGVEDQQVVANVGLLGQADARVTERCIEAHNARVDDIDFVIDPYLHGEKVRIAAQAKKLANLLGWQSRDGDILSYNFV